MKTVEETFLTLKAQGASTYWLRRVARAVGPNGKADARFYMESAKASPRANARAGCKGKGLNYGSGFQE